MTGLKNLPGFLLAGVLVAIIFSFGMPGTGMAEDNDLVSERYLRIGIQGTSAQVGAYERQGRITRLYGEAFSFGASPEESAENFLQRNAYLFKVKAEDLKEQHFQPIMYEHEKEAYKFTGVNYSQYRGGIPVFRSRLVLLVRNEDNYPLVLASADLRNLRDFVPAEDRSGLSADAGISRARSIYPNLTNFSEPKLEIWAGVRDMVVDPVLAYTFIGDNGSPVDGSEPEKYLFVTDAATGEILYEEDMILFVDVEGSVQGKATQGIAADFCEPEAPEGLQWARVNIGTTVAYADQNGDFVIPNSGSTEVTVQSMLWGRWFRVWNQAGAESQLSKTVIPPGPADFMHNEPNTSETYRAEVNGYFQANKIRDFVLYFNAAYPGLQQNEFPVYVNSTGGYCPGNAWYDGSSINFCLAGGGYPNTAWSAVIYHEYGHHLVAMAGSGQGQYGEGLGDAMGVIMQDDPGTGYGFYGDCDVPLRTAENTMQYPCGGEIHYCGQLLTACLWDTRNELIVTEPTQYRYILSNLTVNSILLHTGDLITPQITIDFLTLDDDNGNIYDGTPHYWEIAAGFGAHNMDAPELALLGFSFPDGLPELILPEGGTTVRVEVEGVTAVPEPGTGMIYIDDGTGWDTYAMTEITPNIYDAVFPPVVCGNTVKYYFSAETTTGMTQYWPASAPDEYYVTVSAYGSDLVFTDDFETDLGWTVENSPGLTSGQWERGVPAGNGDRGDPPTDYDGSGKCYVTQNLYGDYDIDGGLTYLMTPTLNLSGGANAKIHYALWYTNDFGADPNNDLFKVYVSNNNGSTWILAETIGPVTPTGGWNEHEFMIGEFVTPNNQVKVRFEASDLNSGSVVEAGVDDFSVTTYQCGPDDVSIQAIPDDPPVIVPRGGYFTYTAILTNNLDAPQSTDVWIMYRLPNGTLRGPVNVYDEIYLGPSQVRQVDGIRQNVPMGAPLGVYDYILNCGNYPDQIVDQSSFEVTVTE